MSILSNAINSFVRCIDTNSYKNNNEEAKPERSLISHDNFPHDMILSADGISKRLESFNNIILDDQSVTTIRSQVYDHLEQVAFTANNEKKKEYQQQKEEYDQKVKNGEPVDLNNPPQKKYDLSALSAITLLFKNRGFSFPELSTIRDLRIYCQKHGKFGENPSFMPGDFYGFSIIAAHNVAKQIVIDENKHICELNLEGLIDIVDAKQPANKAEENIRKSIAQLDNEIFQWLEGKSDELPHILSLEKNENQAERIFNIKN
ncbi:hypothetical protein [Pantoea sp. App145]|uniref:hypothetical protein n=1 Tax=Pantoea sp. App145 TaxID=3071567 RepID=UPI003A7FC478